MKWVFENGHSHRDIAMMKLKFDRRANKNRSTGNASCSAVVKDCVQLLSETTRKENSLRACLRLWESSVKCLIRILADLPSVLRNLCVINWRRPLRNPWLSSNFYYTLTIIRVFSNTYTKVKGSLSSTLLTSSRSHGYTSVLLDSYTALIWLSVTKSVR